MGVAIAIITTLASAVVADRVFERIPHLEDEFSNLWQAEILDEGKLFEPSPPSPDSFLIPFVVDHEGRRFGKYPPGWPVVLSFGTRFDIPWLVNPLLAGFAVWLTYRLGSKIRGQVVGVLAATLSASSPMLLMLSGSFMSHSLSLFLTTAFICAWLDLFNPSSSNETFRDVPRWLLKWVAGLSLGLLVLTRPLTAVGVAAPFLIQGLYLFVSRNREIRIRLVKVGLLVFFTSGLLFLWQAVLTGDPFLNPYSLWWEYDRLGFGPGVGVTETGHNLYWATVNTRFSLRAGLHDLFGWPYLSWLFIPFGLLAFRRRLRGWLVFATFPSLVLVYSAYWIGSWLFGPRYYFESLPGLAITSAVGVAWIAGWLTNPDRFPRLRRRVVYGVLLFLISGNLLFYIPARVGGMRGLYEISREPMRPFQHVDLGRALVIVRSRRWMGYGTLLTLVPPFSESDLLLAISKTAEKNAILEEQFQDRQVYYYYTDEPGIFYSEPR